MRSLSLLVILGCLIGAPSPGRAAVTLGQVDTFEDGTTMNWSEGANSADTLTMRLAFFGSATWYGSADGFRIPPDGAWHQVTFDLSNLTLLVGIATRTQVLNRVTTLRIVAASTPSYQGDAVATTAGVDNITALTLNAPVLPT